MIYPLLTGSALPHILFPGWTRPSLGFPTAQSGGNTRDIWEVLGNGIQCTPSHGWFMTVFKHINHHYHRIGLWEKLQESPIFDGKNPWFPVDVPLNQSSDINHQEPSLTITC